MQIQCDQESKWTCFSFKNCYRMQFKIVNSPRTNHFDVLTIFGFFQKNFFLNLGPILESSGFRRLNSTRGPSSSRGLKNGRVVPDSTDIDPCQNADNDLSIEDAFNHHYYRLYHLSIWPLDFAQKILVHLALVQLSRPDIPFLSI